MTALTLSPNSLGRYQPLKVLKATGATLPELVSGVATEVKINVGEVTDMLSGGKALSLDSSTCNLSNNAEWVQSGPTASQTALPSASVCLFLTIPLPFQTYFSN